MGQKKKKKGKPQLSKTSKRFGLTEPNPEEPLKAVIDVGSSTVRLSAWAYPYTDPYPVIKLKFMPGLAKDLDKTGMLNPEAKIIAKKALREFSKVLSDLQNDGFLTQSDIATMATAAVRDAEDGLAFMKEIENDTGIKLTIISGREEAYYVGTGIEKGLGFDLGGGSLEIARKSKGKVIAAESVPLGVLRMRSVKGLLQEHIVRTLSPYADDISKYKTMTLMGGPFRHIIKSYRLCNNFNSTANEQAEIDALELLKHARKLSRISKTMRWVPENVRDALCETFNIKQERVPHIRSAQILLETLIECYGIKKIRITHANTRYGRMLAMTEPEDKIKAEMAALGIEPVLTKHAPEPGRLEKEAA